MKNWVLTTCVRESPDPYTDRIWPITAPTHAKYASRWGMLYDPHRVERHEEAWMNGTIAAALGTSPVYTAWPHRQELLERYDGVIYIDADAPFLNYHWDLCTAVSDEKPIGMVGDLTGALMVIKSTPESREFCQLVWDMREQIKWAQWAEEGAIKKLMGWEHIWDPRKPGADFIGPTEWTPKLNIIPGALFHPGDLTTPAADWLACNPGGVHPIENRIALIEAAIKGENSAVRFA
jgi:hypothetical protein